MNRERIKPIPGHPKYFISDHGDVYSEHWGRRIKLKPWLLNGYLKVTLVCKNGGKRQWYIHRLVIEAFVGPRPGRKYETCHKDGNPKNCHYKNLRWGTHFENMQDAVRHGHHVSQRYPESYPRGAAHWMRHNKDPLKISHGERCNFSKLTPAQVRAIRKDPGGYGSGVRLAARYGVHRRTIYKIQHRISWRYT